MDLKEYRIKDAKNFIRHPWEIARTSIVEKLLLRYYHKKTAVIIDIGTGDGFFLSQIYKLFNNAKALGLDIFLSDTEELALNNTFKKQNIIITNKQQKAISFAKDNQIDIICLMDILEHIKEDSSFLAQAIKDYNLNSKTYFVITVPAFEKLFSQHDINMAHYRRYTKENLSKLLRDNNLEILETGYFFFSLLLPRSLTCLKEKLFKNCNKIKNTGNWKHGKFLTKVITIILMLDFYFTQLLKKLNISLPGLSVYAIARGVK